MDVLAYDRCGFLLPHSYEYSYVLRTVVPAWHSPEEGRSLRC